MFLREYLEHMVTVGTPAEKVRNLRNSYLYDQLNEMYQVIETIVEAVVYGDDSVVFKDKHFRIDEYHIPVLFTNQFKYANVYLNADDIFDVSVKGLFSLSLSSEKFNNEVGMHPIQFNKFMEELANFNTKLKPSDWSNSNVFVSSIAELGRILISTGDFKISDSNVYVWLSLFENFIVNSDIATYCKKLPPIVGDCGACYELDRVIE